MPSLLAKVALLFLATAAINLAAEPASIVRLLARAGSDGGAAELSAVSPLPLTGTAGKATLRLGHDAQTFQAFVEVSDPSPLRNSAARPEEMLKGGDALAFYFNHPDTGPQRVIFGRIEGKTLIYVHRPRSAEKHPYVFSSPVGSTSFDYVAPLAGATATLATTSYGYTAKIAIPWASLGFKQPPARFGFDFQVIFSDPSGSTNADALWWHATTGPGLTIEDLPTEAALYPDTWGEAVLVEKTSPPAMPVVKAPAPASTVASSASSTIALDLPRDGRLTVVITDSRGWILRELIRAEPRKTGRQTINWDGRDRYGDPLPPGDYRWKALLFDGVGIKFVGSVGNSARPPYRTDDGSGSLGGQHGNQGTVAADAGGVYLGGALQEGEPAFRKINAATGACLWKRSPGSFQSVVAVSADEGFAVLLNSSGKKPAQKLMLVRVDPATGLTIKIDGKNEIELDAPSSWGETADVAIAGGRAIYSIPGEKRLGVIDLKTGGKLPDIALECWGLQRVNENTLLACTKDAVVRLDLATGRTTPVVSGLVKPRDVALDPKTGNLFVSDLGTSQQIKKFSPDGKPLAVFGRVGGKPASMPVYDPLAFDNVTGLVFAADGTLWMKESSATPKRFIHLTTDGKWIEDFCGPVAYNVFGPDLDDVSKVYYNPNESSARFLETKVDYAGYAADPAKPGNWRITAVHDMSLAADGVTVNPLMADVAKEGYGHVIVFTATNGLRYFFRLSKFNRAAAPGGAGLWVWKNNRWVPSVFVSADETRYGQSWRDANGDGLVQDNERFSTPNADRYSWIDRDLTLHGLNGLLAPASLDANGLPVYEGGRFTPHLPDGTPYIGNSDTFASATVGGSVYYGVNWGPHRHMAFWDRATDNRLIKVTNGKVEWVTGIHRAQGGFAEFSTMSGIAGIVDDMVVTHNVEPSSFITYTTDGFVLGDASADPDGVRPKAGGTAVYIEHFTGLLVKDTPTGRRLLFFVVSGDDRIVELTGPGRMNRYEGTLRLATGSDALGGGKVVIPYSGLYGNVTRGLGVDGYDTEWEPTVPRISLSAKNGPVADVRLRRDKGALSLIADILDPTPIPAGGSVELVLGRTAARPEVVLAFTAPSPPAKGGKWTGTATLAREGKSVFAPAIKVAASLRWENLGYHLEAEIPLTLLPEFCAETKQTFKDEAIDPRSGKPTKLGAATATLLDLKAPLFINIRVQRTADGNPSPVSLSAQGLLPVELP